MRFFSSWDDGSKEDLKIAKLLIKYDLPGIFYIPKSGQLCPKEIKGLSGMGFEIGGHTLTHPNDLKLLRYPKLREEVRGCKKWIEEITGKESTTFCYPRGRYNEDVVAVVSSAGFKEARTTIVLNTNVPKDPYRIFTSVHVAQRQEYKGRLWFDVAKDLFDDAVEFDTYFHIWGHGHEIERFNQWKELEAFLKYIKEVREKSNIKFE